MHPILFQLGFFKIYTYGLCIAIGLVLSAYLFIKKASKFYNYSEHFLENFVLYTFISGIVGGRTLYIILNFKYFYENPIDILKIWNGGLVFLGGFILAFLFVIFWTKKHKINFFGITDILAPYLALGHFFGRIGCFMAGCCYGKPTDFFCGVVFHDKHSLAPLNVKIHPSQLYESFSNLLLFFVLLFTLKHRKFVGQIFSYYLIFYSFIRYFIEFTRSDARGNIFVFSTSQFISIFLFIFGVFLCIYQKKKMLMNQ